MTTRSRLWLTIVVASLARVALGAAIGLGVDESYAVAVARPLSLSYYDHPPLVFWIAGAMERITSAGHDLLLRLPFILLFIITIWLLFALTTFLFGERAALITVILAQLIPVFGVSDGGWILPDGPLLLGFAATALCVAHAVLDSSTTTSRWCWLGAGVGAGVAALSKYHAIFLFAGTLLFLLTSPRQRRWLTRPEPYVALLVAVMMAMPVVIWNARHDWASFRFQGGRAGADIGLRSLTALAQNLAGQAGYLLPWVWVPLVWLFIRAIRHGPNDERRWLLVCLGGGPVVVFTLVALGGRAGLPHWPAPGFFLLLPLLGDALARADYGWKRRAVRAYLALSAAIVVLLVGIAASQIRTGWLSRRLPRLFVHGDPSLEALDWSETRRLLAIAPRPPIFVTADWIDGAKLGAALAPDATVLCFSDDPRHFRYFGDQHLLIGDSVLVVLNMSRRHDVASDLGRIAAYFQSVDSVAYSLVELRRGSEIAEGLFVFRANHLLRPYGSAAP